MPLPTVHGSHLVTRRNRSTRTLIAQYSRYHTYGRYLVHCEDHDESQSVWTVEERAHYASHPRLWCGGCRALPDLVPVRRGKRTLGLQRRFGVEIECVHDTPLCPEFNDVARWIRDEANVPCQAWGGSAAWSVKDDGSVTCRYGGGFEIATRPLSGEEGLDELDRVLRVLRKHGFTTNPTCGLHLHLDTEDLTARQIGAFVRTWHNNRDLIEWLVDANRRDGADEEYTDYFIPVEENMLIAIEASSTKSELVYLTERYNEINLRSLRQHGTIEIRKHHGTLSFNAISAWVRFATAILDAICVKSTALPKSLGVRSLLDALPVDIDTKAYLLGNALVMGGPAALVAA